MALIDAVPIQLVHLKELRHSQARRYMGTQPKQHLSPLPSSPDLHKHRPNRSSHSSPTTIEISVAALDDVRCFEGYVDWECASYEYVVTNISRTKTHIAKQKTCCASFEAYPKCAAVDLRKNSASF